MHHPALLSEPEALDLERFFSDTCRRVLEARRQWGEALGGRVCFSLSGDDGGAWTLDLTQGTVSVGAVQPIDMVVAGQAADFVRLTRPAEARQVVEEGRLTLGGDVSVLAKLLLVLGPRDRIGGSSDDGHPR